MPSTRDPMTEALKILLVADNGAGKSTVAGSFYKAGPTRFHDFDGRMLPVKRAYPEADINYDTFDASNFRKYFDELEALQDKCPWKVLVTDSVTSASTSCVLHQLKTTGKFKSGQEKLPATSWDEVNRETVWFTEMLEASCKVIWKKFNTHIIWIAHPIPKTTIEDGEVKRHLSIVAYGNKVPGLIPGYFNEIYNIQLEKVGVDTYKRVLYTVDKNGMPGKTALGLPARIDITNKNFYDELMQLIKT